MRHHAIVLAVSGLLTVGSYTFAAEPPAAAIANSRDAQPVGRVTACFGQMLLDNGKAGSTRILSRLSVEAMTTSQITPEQRVSAGFFLDDNRSWGFGVSMITRRDDVASVPGRFGWDGGFGTSFYVDPTEALIGILLCQRMPPTADISLDFWTSVYQAIDD